MKHQTGFTLIEVLLALMLVSMMSVLAWRGLEGIGRAGEHTLAQEQGLHRVQTSLAQWRTDLDAVFESGVVKALDFDGARLHLTRRSTQPATGVIVVTWTLRATEQGSALQRYASDPVQTRAALQAAWIEAERWARTPLPSDAGKVATLIPVTSWQLFYFRGVAWSNAQSASSTSDASPPSASAPASKPALDPLPDGIRLVLTLPDQAGLHGSLVRDWMRPSLGSTP